MSSKTIPTKIVDLTRDFPHAIVKLYGFMLKKLVFLSAWFLLAPPFIILVLFSFSKNNQNFASSNSSDSLKVTQIQLANSIEGEVLATKIQDARPYIVEKFLRGTPLAAYSTQIIEVSDKYNLDYRLIPAIAMKESQAGLAVDQSTHNAWGFDNGKTVFNSWESAIDSVGKTLKTRYIDRGLTTPEEIMAIYAPPQLSTGGQWAKDINFFFSKMETL